MKPKSILPFFLVTFLLISCSEDKSSSKNESVNVSSESKTTSASPQNQAGGIVGEWEQVHTYFDKNGNFKLEPEEKNPSNTRLGFNWFKFNSDGTSLRDKDIKFEGTYSIEEKNGAKKLVIQGGDNLRYSIEELSDKELILGASGAFIVFKRM